MAMSAALADTTLGNLTGAYVVLHTGSPGADGEGNVAVAASDSAMTPKQASFAAAANHGSNTERVRVSNAELAFDGTELKPGQTVTHVSIWDGPDGPGTDSPLFIAALASPKLVGADGAKFDSGEIEVAIEVFAKP